MNIGIQNIYDDTVLVHAAENQWSVKIGDLVIASHGKHKEIAGKVVFLDRKKLAENEIILDGEILRKADQKDLAKIEKQKSNAVVALEKARAKIDELDLPMRLNEARFSFDDGEVNFFYTAGERIDFKEVVPKLAGAMKKRIHLSQLGQRDRAKMVGGFGICGRRQCCSGGALQKFHSITMEMVKTQELIMKGSDKLSGPCGKLLCCLRYELEEYERLRKKMPSWGSTVTTEKGVGKVISLDILNQRIKIYLEKGGVQFFSVADIKRKIVPHTVVKKVNS